MNSISHLLIPVGILATVGAATSSSPTLSQYGETIGVVTLLLYFLWERTNECKQLRKENNKLIEKLTHRETPEECEHESNKQSKLKPPSTITKNDHENSN